MPLPPPQRPPPTKNTRKRAESIVIKHFRFLAQIDHSQVMSRSTYIKTHSDVVKNALSISQTISNCYSKSYESSHLHMKPHNITTLPIALQPLHIGLASYHITAVKGDKAWPSWILKDNTNNQN